MNKFCVVYNKKQGLYSIYESKYLVYYYIDSFGDEHITYKNKANGFYDYKPMLNFGNGRCLYIDNKSDSLIQGETAEEIISQYMQTNTECGVWVQSQNKHYLIKTPQSINAYVVALVKQNEEIVERKMITRNKKRMFEDFKGESLSQDDKDFLLEYIPKDTYFTSDEEIALVNKQFGIDTKTTSELSNLRNAIVDFYSDIFEDMEEGKERVEFYKKYWCGSMQSLTAIIDYELEKRESHSKKIYENFLDDLDDETQEETRERVSREVFNSLIRFMNISAAYETYFNDIKKKFNVGVDLKTNYPMLTYKIINKRSDVYHEKTRKFLDLLEDNENFYSIDAKWNNANNTLVNSLLTMHNIKTIKYDDHNTYVDENSEYGDLDYIYITNDRQIAIFIYERLIKITFTHEANKEEWLG